MGRCTYAPPFVEVARAASWSHSGRREMDAERRAHREPVASRGAASAGFSPPKCVPESTQARTSSKNAS
eukprot:7352357-Prymnesium_polylepis.1